MLQVYVKFLATSLFLPTKEEKMEKKETSLFLIIDVPRIWLQAISFLLVTFIQ